MHHRHQRGIGAGELFEFVILNFVDIWVVGWMSGIWWNERWKNSYSDATRYLQIYEKTTNFRQVEDSKDMLWPSYTTWHQVFWFWLMDMTNICSCVGLVPDVAKPLPLSTYSQWDPGNVCKQIGSACVIDVMQNSIYNTCTFCRKHTELINIWTFGSVEFS